MRILISQQDGNFADKRSGEDRVILKNLNRSRFCLGSIGTTVLWKLAERKNSTFPRRTKASLLTDNLTAATVLTAAWVPTG